MENLGKEKQADLAPEEVADLGAKIREAAEKLAVPAPAEKEPVPVIFPETPSKPEAVPSIVPETGPKPVEVKPEENIPANIAVAPETPAKPEMRPQSGSVLTQAERERIWGKPISKKSESAPAGGVLVSAEEAEEFGLEPEIPVVAEKPKEEKTEMGVQIPIMVTREMRQRLGGMGVKDADIDNLTPQEAWNILNKEKGSSERAKEEPVTESKPKPAEKPEEKLQEKFQEKPLAERVAEKKLEKPEEVKKEKTPEDLDLEDPAARFGFGAKAKKLFNKLTDRPRGAVAGLYHFYAGDRVELAYSKFWSGRHEKKAAAAQDELDALHKEISFADELAAGLSRRAEELKKEHGVDVGIKAQVKSMHEIQEEKLRLEKEADSAMAKLEKQNAEKERFSGRRERVCRKFIDIYDEQIRPLESGLGDAKTNKEKITSELNGLRERQKTMKDGLQKLETELAREKYPAFKVAINKAIQDIRRNLIAGDRLVRETEGELDKYEKRIIKLNSKANEWKADRNKYARIAGLETAKIGSAQTTENISTGGAVSATPEKKEPEKETRMKLGDYVQKWNEGFAYGVALNEAEMQKLIPPEKVDAEMDLDAFEDLAMQYQEAALTAKGKQFGGKARSGIKKKIGWLEVILNTQF